MTTTTKSNRGRVAFGVPGLDQILGGGLTADRLYLIEGQPGTGKTTLALQFLREGTRRGERGIYVALSETRDELAEIARSHGWDLGGITILDLQTAPESLEASSQYTFFHPSEIELGETTRAILEAVERIGPQRLVFDSLSEMRLLARDSLRYRRQLLTLKHHLASHRCTGVLLDIGGLSDGFQLESMVHGVVRLSQEAREYGGQRRRLRIEKMRGIDFVEGFHDFRIRTGGVVVYPRLVAAVAGPVASGEPLTSGLDGLDELTGGGLERGTTTMLLGPSGAGKSTLATLYAAGALERGENVAIYLFDEHEKNWRLRTESLGVDFTTAPGRLLLRQIDPAELAPGEFSAAVRQAVEEEAVTMVVIDSLNGYRNAMPEEHHLNLHLHELFSYLAQRGVVALVVMAQDGLIGPQVQSPLRISYLADTVVLLRYFECLGDLRKAISVIKKRTGFHDRSIRELSVNGNGLEVGERLERFGSVLGGETALDGHEEVLVGGGSHGGS